MFWCITNWVPTAGGKNRAKGSSVGSPKPRTLEEWHHHSGTQEGAADLMGTRPHLTRAVSRNCPRGVMCPSPAESRDRAEVMLRASFKSALGRESRAQSKIWCKNAESQDFGLEDKDLHSQIAVWAGRWEEVLLCSHLHVLPKAPQWGRPGFCVGVRYCEARCGYFYEECG